ncbi:hypothetical protein [Nocardioides daeguensis]|uniref:Uncharacterized protein n=1 Tax=Nocardioides daeguensis TaxID=908359 RepID=A0ABP6UT91_9ACTN|nr:hypothetical protein [Nocardioides daeguensis]MBV6729208.1 hypothetical protein [Nocardioides daeguensis]MCR1774775.1 hypothetical protein [Nocardioides daeguensis]
MSESVHVIIDDLVHPALLLKWDGTRMRALVTLEVDGRVDTRWVMADLVQPSPA